MHNNLCYNGPMIALGPRSAIASTRSLRSSSIAGKRSRIKCDFAKSFRAHSYEKSTRKSFKAHSYENPPLQLSQNHTLTKKEGGSGAGGEFLAPPSLLRCFLASLLRRFPASNISFVRKTHVQTSPRLIPLSAS